MSPTLHDWAVCSDGIGPFDDPSLATGFVCSGVVTGHDKVADGTLVTTSVVQKLSTSTNTAQTLNTTYTLGAMHPRYARWRARREKEGPVEYDHSERVRTASGLSPD